MQDFTCVVLSVVPIIFFDLEINLLFPNKMGFLSNVLNVPYSILILLTKESGYIGLHWSLVGDYRFKYIRVDVVILISDCIM